MELFGRISKEPKFHDSKEPQSEEKEAFKNALGGREIEILPLAHTAEEIFYGEDPYRISFQVNDAFKPAKSHAGEVEMLHTYAPFSLCGEEGADPYLAIQCDDVVYTAVEEFKESGTFSGALEITPLAGPFFFKAKTEYFGSLMYFYGMDCCGGSNENQGLCLVYSKGLAGTENEKKLMAVLDEAAVSYREERIV